MVDILSSSVPDFDLFSVELADIYERNETIWNSKQDIVDVLSRLLSSAATAAFRTLLGSEEDEDAIRRAAIEQQEREFHSYVRQQIICLLLLISLYLIAYWIISRFKSKSDSDSLYSGDDDYFVYRICVWMCTFSLAVSVGSIALLPFSVLSAELIQRYPDNYYLQWLSWSLVNSLWNYVFTLSNLSLFVLLPFSYFFIESQGFSKSKNGIMQRVYETLAVCALLIVVLLCLADVVLALISSSVSLISITSVNLPLIYSCVSLCGVALLLVSTPFGFAKIFGIVGDLSTIPVPDVDDLTMERLERKYQQRVQERNGRSGAFVLRHGSTAYGADSSNYRIIHRVNGSPALGAGDNGNGDSADVLLPVKNVPVPSYWHPVRPDLDGASSPKVWFSFWVPLREKSLRWYQHVMHIVRYPVIIVSLLLLTGISVLMVVINSLKLMFGYRSLPVYAQYMEVQTRHTFGMVGVAIEIVTILYVMAISLVGLYSMPFIRALRPKRKGTSMTAIIINCSLILVVSSALPVLANTLGITTFDLLGAYSSLEWLSNFRLVLAYNVMFAAVTIVCLFTQITSPVRKQIMRRLNELRCRGPLDEPAEECLLKAE